MSDLIKVVRVGVAVLLWRGGKFLMGLRKSEHGKGTWSLPGGHIEWGESHLDAAVRETYEETGLVVQSPRPHLTLPYVHTIFSNGKQYITLYIDADYVDGEAVVREPDKCERWEWFAPDDLPSPLFEPIDPKLLFP